MINRKILKEVLEIEAKKAGSVRALARHSKINPTSLQKYIDEETIPGGEMIGRIAAYCRKSPSYFFDESASTADSHPTDASVPLVHKPQKSFNERPVADDLLSNLVKTQVANLLEMQRSMNRMHEMIIDLEGELGDIKSHMIDTALSGDIQRLGMTGVKEK